MKRKIRDALFAIISAILIILIVIYTLKVIFLTKNPVLFGIDFTNKGPIIESYSALTGTILTFLSILFILYTIVQTREQFIDERKENEINRKSDLLDRLKLVSNFINDITNHITLTGTELEKFYKNEDLRPLALNQLKFCINKNYFRILEMDLLSLFKSFQLYYKSENWENEFNDLYHKIDYYAESLIELRSTYEKHVKDKSTKKLEIAFEMEQIMYEITSVLYRLKSKFPDNYQENASYILLNDYTLKYYDLIKVKEEEETDFNQLSNELILPYLEKAINHIPNEEFEEEFRRIMISSSILRKKIWRIKTEALQYSKSIKASYVKYYYEKSAYLIRLKEIQTNLDNKIKACG